MGKLSVVTDKFLTYYTLTETRSSFESLISVPESLSVWYPELHTHKLKYKNDLQLTYVKISPKVWKQILFSKIFAFFFMKIFKNRCIYLIFCWIFPVQRENGFSDRNFVKNVTGQNHPDFENKGNQIGGI